MCWTWCKPTPKGTGDKEMVEPRMQARIPLVPAHFWIPDSLPLPKTGCAPGCLHPGPLVPDAVKGGLDIPPPKPVKE